MVISAFGLQVQSGNLLYSDLFFTLVTRPSMSVSQARPNPSKDLDQTGLGERANMLWLLTCGSTPEGMTHQVHSTRKFVRAHSS